MQQDQNDPVYDLAPPTVPTWWKVLKFIWRVVVYLFIIISMIGLVGGSIGAIIHFFGGVNNLP